LSIAPSRTLGKGMEKNKMRDSLVGRGRQPKATPIVSGDKNCTGHSQSEAARVIEELVVNVRSRIPKRNHAIEVQDTCGVGKENSTEVTAARPRLGTPSQGRLCEAWKCNGKEMQLMMQRTNVRNERTSYRSLNRLGTQPSPSSAFVDVFCHSLSKKYKQLPLRIKC